MIYGIPLPALTPLGLLCFALAFPYLQMARGKLVPRSTMLDVIKDRDEWRSAQQISETARADLAHQVGELLEHARTTDAFIRSLPRPDRESP
jgi:hypothetical protein